MMRSMYSGISGIRAHQMKMDVVANNIANVNTVGFKASRVTFQEVLNQTIAPAFGSDASSSSGLGGVNAQQIGLGVSIGSIDVLQNSAGPQTTNRSLDVSIDGEGFFMVTDGVNQFYTRAGNFYLDSNKNLVNENGYKVCDSSGATLSFTSDVKSVDINTAGELTGYSIDAAGTSQKEVVGKLGIANFTNPQGLTKVGGNLYKETSNSGAATTGDPSSNGFSSLIPGSLEMSNVDLSQEFTDMIIAQRGFQANSRVITTSNDMLQELAGIIR